jgi:hypothetical protein
MSRGQVVVMTGSTVMALAAMFAAALIWITATDPLFVAALAATGDVMAMLSGIGIRVIESIW